jgi:hypothetical protein
MLAVHPAASPNPIASKALTLTMPIWLTGLPPSGKNGNPSESMANAAQIHGIASDSRRVLPSRSKRSGMAIGKS